MWILGCSVVTWLSTAQKAAAFRVSAWRYTCCLAPHPSTSFRSSCCSLAPSLENAVGLQSSLQHWGHVAVEGSVKQRAVCRMQVTNRFKCVWNRRKTSLGSNAQWSLCLLCGLGTLSGTDGESAPVSYANAIVLDLCKG